MEGEPRIATEHYHIAGIEAERSGGIAPLGPADAEQRDVDRQVVTPRRDGDQRGRGKASADGAFLGVPELAPFARTHLRTRNRCHIRFGPTVGMPPGQRHQATDADGQRDEPEEPDDGRREFEEDGGGSGGKPFKIAIDAGNGMAGPKGLSPRRVTLCA